MHVLRLCGAVALFIVGWWGSFAGWLLASGDHGPPRLALGVVVSLAGLEITMVSYALTRRFRWELVFRAAVYMYFVIRALLSLLVAVDRPDARGFAVTFAAICLINVGLLYAWAGVKRNVKAMTR